eukprot:TRINITY_DN9865_c0_g3_i2.p3 TRINITY_DN9865_c0_g3~~TRINITY_DN9865_c0_g3_i2.p3  ORF type:complete len:137 (+),score=1.18 TRINITY_DN9865_c0_g3_i2:516-926(+)
MLDGNTWKLKKLTKGTRLARRSWRGRGWKSVVLATKSRNQFVPTNSTLCSSFLVNPFKQDDKNNYQQDNQHIYNMHCNNIRLDGDEGINKRKMLNITKQTQVSCAFLFGFLYLFNVFEQGLYKMFVAITCILELVE